MTTNQLRTSFKIRSFHSFSNIQILFNIILSSPPLPTELEIQTKSYILNRENPREQYLCVNRWRIISQKFSSSPIHAWDWVSSWTLIWRPQILYCCTGSLVAPYLVHHWFSPCTIGDLGNCIMEHTNWTLRFYICWMTSRDYWCYCLIADYLKASTKTKSSRWRGSFIGVARRFKGPVQGRDLGPFTF